MLAKIPLKYIGCSSKVLFLISSKPRPLQALRQYFNCGCIACFLEQGCYCYDLFDQSSKIERLEIKIKCSVVC